MDGVTAFNILHRYFSDKEASNLAGEMGIPMPKSRSSKEQKRYLAMEASRQNRLGELFTKIAMLRPNLFPTVALGQPGLPQETLEPLLDALSYSNYMIDPAGRRAMLILAGIDPDPIQLNGSVEVVSAMILAHCLQTGQLEKLKAFLDAANA